MKSEFEGQNKRVEATTSEKGEGVKNKEKRVEVQTSEKGETECKKQKKRESTTKMSLFALTHSNTPLPSSLKSVLQVPKSNHELKTGKKFIGQNEQAKNLKDRTKLKYDHQVRKNRKR